MSNPLKHPVHGSLAIGGLIVVLVGVIGLGPHTTVGAFVVAAVGIGMEMVAAWLHDRMHRRRGETPHAVWGTNDRNRPRWLGGRR